MSSASLTAVMNTQEEGLFNASRFKYRYLNAGCKRILFRKNIFEIISASSWGGINAQMNKFSIGDIPHRKPASLFHQTDQIPFKHH